MRNFLVVLILFFLVGIPAAFAAGKKAGQYELVSNPAKKAVCEEFLKNLKEFEDEDFSLTEVKVSPKYPQFQNLDWEEMDVKSNLEFFKKVYRTMFSSNEQTINSFDKSFAEGRYFARKAKVENLIPNQTNTIIQFLSPPRLTTMEKVTMY